MSLLDLLAHCLPRRGAILLVPGLLALCAAWPACAEMRALLVGVSGYADRPLKGPRNDVRRMREVLEQRAFKPAQITTLADGVAGAGAPTRAAILSALDGLAASAQTGDQVFLYFSGHGSQQPADRSTPQGRAEADGLHETFLPLDIGRWDGRAGTVQNAIVDFELREKVDGILARGAFVWAVFDACHSASLVRGLSDDEVRDRQMSPRELGVPQALMDAAVANAAAAPAAARGATPMPSFAAPHSAPGSGAGTGEAVYFYAAQTTETTPEMRLPPNEAQREDQGLFSFVLRRALASGRPMSYRQLGQVMLAHYGGMNQTGTTPLFAGNALDRLVFGQQAAPLRQWPVSRERMTVPAGTLSGLAPGARFALLPSAAADAGQAIGMLQAVRVGLNYADLEPVVATGAPVNGLDKIPAGAQARLLSSPERFSLRLAVDERACRAGCRWRAVLDALRSQGVPGTELQWVGDAGDLSLRFGERELVGLAPGDAGSADCGPRATPCKARSRGVVLLSAADGDDPARQARRLAERLHAVARAHNLLRLAALATVPVGPGVEVGVAIAPEGAGATARRVARAESVTAAIAGERLVVSLQNRGTLPADVTVLYLDATLGIDLQFPSRAGDVNRLEPGARQEIGDIVLNNDNGVFGLERLLVISVEAERQTERADFSFLVQSPLQAARQRGAALDDDVGAFFDAAFADTRSRDTPPRLPGQRTRMQMFSIDLAPPKAAAAR